MRIVAQASQADPDGFTERLVAFMVNLLPGRHLAEMQRCTNSLSLTERIATVDVRVRQRYFDVFVDLRRCGLLKFKLRF